MGKSRLLPLQAANRLVAYKTPPASQARRSSGRGDWNPVVLFALLAVLVIVVSVQIIVIYTYGGANTDISYTAFYSGQGGYGGFHGGLFARWAFVSPPPRINLYSLLNRNVISIEENKARLYEKINADKVNSIIEHDAQANFTFAKLRSKALPDCSPSKFYGQILPNISHSHAESYTNDWISSQVPELQPGGMWHPVGCHPRHAVAIIVPYRDRQRHLRILLAHLHPILQRQQLDYKIYVVEQFGNKTFNKARIMNIAFVRALEDRQWDCFVFHDVDLVPEDDRNMYSCPSQPRHMSPAIDEMNYKIPYDELVGGVLAIRTEHFFQVNGYSNLYWGWGAEDDDLAYRYRLLWTGVKRYKIDGINSLTTLAYKILHVKPLPLYTHILVDIGSPPPGF